MNFGIGAVTPLLTGVGEDLFLGMGWTKNPGRVRIIDR
jgi:hypothetical protein